MADISMITLPDKSQYNFKDTVARQASKRVNVSSGNTANYPLHRFAYIENATGQYLDFDSVFLIRAMYDGGSWGILKISMRTNSEAKVLASESSQFILTESNSDVVLETGSDVSVSAKWLIREGFSSDSIQIYENGYTGYSCYADAFIKTGTWARIEVVRLSSRANSWEMCDSNEASDTTTSNRKTSVNCFSSVSDAATQLHGGVSYLKSSESIDVGNSKTVNGHTVDTDVPNDAKFTDTTYPVADENQNGLISSEDFQLIHDNKTEIDTHTDSISSMQNQISDIQDSVSDLQNSVSDLQSRTFYCITTTSYDSNTNTGTVDKTYSEITDALKAGEIPYISDGMVTGSITYYYFSGLEENGFTFAYRSSIGLCRYIAIDQRGTVKFWATNDIYNLQQTVADLQNELAELKKVAIITES